jgi:GT2 family glycosyltransferase
VAMKVSVLIPTYKRRALLAETLASLTTQTMDPALFEVIVVNDGGPADAVPPIPAGLTGQVIHLPENQGLSAALNVAFAASVGRYVTVSSDDDLVLSHKLLALSVALDAAPDDTAAVFGYPIYTDVLGREIGCPESVRRFLREHPVVTSEIALSRGLYVHGTAPMYRRSGIEAIGGWDETLPTAEEFDLHHRLLRFVGVFRGVDVAVVTYRAGGKHLAHKSERGKRPRSVMDRIYAKVK